MAEYQNAPILVTPTDLLSSLDPAEQRLILFIRHLGHGSLEIKVVNGRPAMIERGFEKVKLL